MEKCKYGVKQSESLEHDECFDCEYHKQDGKDLYCNGGTPGVACDKAPTCAGATDRCRKAPNCEMICHPTKRWMYCYEWKKALGLVFDKELGIYILPETKTKLIENLHNNKQVIKNE